MSDLARAASFSQEIRFRVIACSEDTTPTHLDGDLKGVVSCHHDLRPGMELVAVAAREFDMLRAAFSTLYQENVQLRAQQQRLLDGLSEVESRLRRIQGK